MKKLLYVVLLICAWSVESVVAQSNNTQIEELRERIADKKKRMVSLNVQIKELAQEKKQSRESLAKLYRLEKQYAQYEKELERLNLELDYEKAGLSASEYVVGYKTN